jgi:hypothetical protein
MILENKEFWAMFGDEPSTELFVNGRGELSIYGGAVGAPGQRIVRPANGFAAIGIEWVDFADLQTCWICKPIHI